MAGMIVSHEHRFIFLKTLKTAGTSVEIALSRSIGPHDVVTAFGASEDEALRRSSGGRGPQRTAYPLRRLHRYRAGDWARLLRGRGRKRAYNHMPASEIRELVGTRVWDGYTKFAIERNPWDAAVSFYWFRYAGSMPFDEYLRTHGVEMLRRNRRIVTLGGGLAVDALLRYESLQSELDEMAPRLGLAGSLELPHAKSGFRPASSPYQEMYDAASVALVAEAAAPLIELRGYSFDGA